MNNVTSAILNKYIKSNDSSFPQDALRLFFQIQLFIQIKFLITRHKLLALIKQERKKLIMELWKKKIDYETVIRKIVKKTKNIVT